MTSVTLDSNVYVSALEFAGIGARFLGMAQMGGLRIDASDAIIDETLGLLRITFVAVSFLTTQGIRFSLIALRLASETLRILFIAICN